MTEPIGPRPNIISGRWAELRPIRPGDYPMLYAAETGTRWRLRHGTPSPREYEDILWRGILAQYVVFPRGGEAMGLVAVYRADMVNGHAYLLASRWDETMASSVAFVEGVALFVDHVFNAWPFRKLYLETDERLAEQFSSLFARDEFPIEGRLREHVFSDGRYVDLLTFALYRTAWSEYIHAWRASEPASRLEVAERLAERAET